LGGLEGLEGAGWRRWLGYEKDEVESLRWSLVVEDCSGRDERRELNSGDPWLVFGGVLDGDGGGI
jgi:hypothetical protein